MLSEIKTNYDSIIKKFAPKLSSSKKEEAKKQLLSMAKNKEPRPKKDSKLGKALSTFIRKNHKDYDKKFSDKIRKLAPKWFFLGTKSKSIGKDTVKRGSSFLNKFKLLTILIHQDKEEILNKEKLCEIYYANSSNRRSSIHADKLFLCRIMNVFESIGLVYSTDINGNKINLNKVVSKNKFSQRYWKISKNIEEKLGFNKKPKAVLWKTSC